MATKKKTKTKAPKAKTPSKPRKPREDTAATELEVEVELKNGPKTKSALARRSVVTGEKLANDPKLGSALARLQRKGRVTVQNGRWALAGFKLCPQCKGKGWIEE
jgi:hypothetical protein